MKLLEKGTVYLIDDDDSMRKSLVGALKKLGYCVKDFYSPSIFLEETYHITRPSVVLLDMQMPEMSGIELQEQLNKQGLLMPIIFISGQSHPEQIITGMKQGAVDFLLKPFLLEELMRSIDQVLESEVIQSNLYYHYSSLTPREKEIFIHLAKGKMNKEIANELDISESMVKVHKSRVMEKMQATSVQALTTYYHLLKI